MAHFKSGRREDQQILHRQTMPTSVADTYQHCNRPPALNEFTSYRDDDKEGLKFYTDPNYFYRLWVEEQNSLLEKRKKRVREFFIAQLGGEAHQLRCPTCMYVCMYVCVCMCV